MLAYIYAAKLARQACALAALALCDVLPVDCYLTFRTSLCFSADIGASAIHADALDHEWRMTSQGYIRHAAAQRCGYCSQRLTGWIDEASLDEADIGRRKRCTLGKLGLREARSFPACAQR